MSNETPNRGPEPSGTRRNDTSLWRVIAAGWAHRRPSRAQDQPIYWTIRAVKELGFPVVVALILLLKMPSWVREAVASDARVRAEQHHELLATISQSKEAFDANTAVLQQLVLEAQELRSASDTVRGMVLGRLRCPGCPACRLSCPTVHVEGARSVSAPAPAPPATQRQPVWDPNGAARSIIEH
jgi:hypothetical protein